jgi:hypothetical protein
LPGALACSADGNPAQLSLALRKFLAAGTQRVEYLLECFEFGR